MLSQNLVMATDISVHKGKAMVLTDFIPVTWAVIPVTFSGLHTT